MVQLDLAKIAAPLGCWMVDAHGVSHGEWACPSQPAVQDLWIEAVARCAEPAIELCGLGFRGDGGFFSSICFCPACMYGYGAAGGILEQVAREGDAPTHPSVNLMLLWRRSVQYGLLKQIREAYKGTLWLRTAAELRYTGEASLLTFEEARGLVDACTVVPEDAARAKGLSRPMPVYVVTGDDYQVIA